MAKKPTVTTVASGYYGRQALNDNFEALRDAFDNTLSRDGSTPNAMGADFDVNGYRILNAGQIDTDALYLNGVAITSASDVEFQTTYLTASYTGDGSTVAYSLTANPQSEGNVSIYVDGVYQNKDTFSLSGTTVTFSEAPPLNAAIEIVYPTNTDTLNGSTSSAITYNQGGTNAQDRNVQQKLQEFVSVKDFGAVGDGVTDDTAAIQAALDSGAGVVIVPKSTSVYCCDSLITIPEGIELKVERGAELKRTTSSSSTDPVVFVKGINSKLTGCGTIRTDNNHPRGVVVCGHYDLTTSNYNAQKWLVSGVDIYGKLAGSTGSANTTVGTVAGTSANIGIYVPSSQPVIGSSTSNYFGSIINVRVNQADVGICFMDQANAHQVVDVFMQDMYGSYLMMHGAYGNVITGVWCHRAKDVACKALYLRDKYNPSAPFVAGHDTLRNTIHGFQNENQATAETVSIEAGSRDNWILFQHNTVGSSIVDANGENWYFEHRGAMKVETLDVTTGGDIKATDLTITKSSLPTLTLLDSDETVKLSKIEGDNNGTMNLYAGEGGGSGIFRVYTGGTERFRIDNASGHTTSGADNTQTLGSASKRWSVVYAGTGTINTSDKNEKQDIASLDAAELATASAIKGLIKKFRFKDAVSTKGDAARVHVGVIAQEVKSAFDANGLDVSQYGIFCSDTWTDEETGEEKTRLGVRYEELLAFIIAAM